MAHGRLIVHPAVDATGGVSANLQNPPESCKIPYVMMKKNADVIVIGGGHAGCEAALAAARAGASVFLLTQNALAMGRMSCNPAIGGIGKGHLVKEIDALGGLMGLAADAAGIQYRTLNASRGAAVRATRAQSDRRRYAKAVQRAIAAANADAAAGNRQATSRAHSKQLQVVEGEAQAITIRRNAVCGVKLKGGKTMSAPTVVLTAGTFLGGVMHVGNQQTAGGRVGCPPSTDLAESLRAYGFPVGRLKTGTPPRLDGRTIDFSQLQEQPGDVPPPRFSFVGGVRLARQVSCHITNTNEKTHDIIRAALHQSPVYSGAIGSVGPRYCPSVEDKVSRFAARPSHRIFLEPEGLNTHDYYPNGISTALPESVQREFVASIDGLQQSVILQMGYAIEYDYFDPRALHSSLQTRAVRGLFFAGQINGTTGYEEAAAQGLVAGLNAARMTRDLPPWIPRRDQSYMGVLIDDLTVRGVCEPYRMFTSRAECRLSLREDNADLRLTPSGRELGIIHERRWKIFNQRRARLEAEETRLKQLRVYPPQPQLRSCPPQPQTNHAPPQTAAAWLRRPDGFYADLADMGGVSPSVKSAMPLMQRADIAEIESRFKYAGYIAHQQAQLAAAAVEDTFAIPSDLDFDAVGGLSTEVRELFARHHPANIRQARRISGITPAALSLLSAHLKSRARAA